MTEAEARAQEAVVEAVLFTMGRSVETRELAAALECADAEAEAAAERLAKRYGEAEACGMQIIRLEKRWQMCTKKEYYDALKDRDEERLRFLLREGREIKEALEE